MNFAEFWSDAAARKALLADPRAGLTALGITIPDDVAVKVISSKGSPADADSPSLIQFLMEKHHRLAHFFLPSPRSPCAQQATYGHILSRDPDDPAFDRVLHAQADAAIARLLAATSSTAA